MSQQISVSPPPHPAVYGNQPHIPAPPVVQDPLLYKNQLNTYAAKLGFPVPVYATINEGAAHAPLFRVTVFVDNTQYTSPNLFTNKKYAEQETAKIALEALLNKVNNEGLLFINENIIFCKAVLHEYAAKMHFDLPTYQTNQQRQQGVDAFVSSLVFKGATFTGQVARNKKDAELLAARAAVLSILGTPGPESALITKIIKSKYKSCIGLSRGNSSTGPNVTPMSLNISTAPNVNNSGSPMNKGKEVVITETTNDVANGAVTGNPSNFNSGSKGKELMTTEATNDVATGAVIGNPSNYSATVQVQNQPCHEFGKPTETINDMATGAVIGNPSNYSATVQPCHEFEKKPTEVTNDVATTGAVIGNFSNHSATVQIQNQPCHEFGKKPTGITDDVASGAVIGNPSNYSATVQQVQYQPWLELNIPILDTATPTAPITPPKPSVHEQNVAVGPTSSKKRRKNKKKKQQPVAQPVIPSGGAIATPIEQGASERENQLGKTAFIRIWNNPFHQDKKLKIDTPAPSAAITPNMFGSPAQLQPAGPGPSAAITPNMFGPPAQPQPAGPGPSSAKKHRKKKKKVRQPIAEFPQPIMPTSQVPCSVPQAEVAPWNRTLPFSGLCSR